MLSSWPLREAIFLTVYQCAQRTQRYAITHNIRNTTMMQLSLSGGGIMSAYYPSESELSKRVRRLIRAARKHLEGLCHQL
nr:MAG TPA: CIII protein family protein [Caudoviricetes sp.]